MKYTLFDTEIPHKLVENAKTGKMETVLTHDEVENE